MKMNKMKKEKMFRLSVLAGLGLFLAITLLQALDVMPETMLAEELKRVGMCFGMTVLFVKLVWNKIKQK